jgi:hypothetical protein
MTVLIGRFARISLSIGTGRDLSLQQNILNISYSEYPVNPDSDVSFLDSDKESTPRLRRTPPAEGN